MNKTRMSLLWSLLSLLALVAPVAAEEAEPVELKNLDPLSLADFTFDFFLSGVRVGSIGSTPKTQEWWTSGGDKLDREKRIVDLDSPFADAEWIREFTEKAQAAAENQRVILRQFVFSEHVVPETPLAPYVKIQPSPLATDFRYVKMNLPEFNGRSSRTLFLAVALPATAQEATLTFRYPSPVWSSISSRPENGRWPWSWEPVTLEPLQHGENVHVRVPGRCDTPHLRLIGLDHERSRIVPSGLFVKGDAGSPQTHFVFKKLDLKDVSKFELEMRNLRSVTWSHVSLHSGQSTKDEMDSEINYFDPIKAGLTREKPVVRKIDAISVLFLLQELLQEISSGSE